MAKTTACFSQDVGRYQRPRARNLSDVWSGPPDSTRDPRHTQEELPSALPTEHPRSNSEESLVAVVSAAAMVTALLSGVHTVVMVTACAAADFFFSDQILRVNMFSFLLNEGSDSVQVRVSAAQTAVAGLRAGFR